MNSVRLFLISPLLLSSGAAADQREVPASRSLWRSHQTRAVYRLREVASGNRKPSALSSERPLRDRDFRHVVGRYRHGL